jgi:hypothetical protein
VIVRSPPKLHRRDVLLLGAALAACAPAATAPDSAVEGAPLPPAPDAGAARSPEPAGPPCADLIRQVSGAAVAPGLEAWHAARPRILLETRATPVLYLRRPAEPADPRAADLRRALAESRMPRSILRRLLHKLRGDKPLLRDVVLSEGYLFAESPRLAQALVAELRLADLFDEGEIFVHGPAGPRRLRREADAYLDGEGNRKALLLGDRLALDEAGLRDPLHLDLGLARSGWGARLARPLAVDRDRAVVRLTWPDARVAEALLSLRDGGTEVTCIDAPAEELARTAADAAEFWSWVAELMAATRSKVEERPKFDEPRDEPEGVQEDGELRQAWKTAYFKGQRTFRFREEEYPVFDRRGNPVPPQVCIDFVFDTIERAAGTWYARRGQRPRRTSGYLDFGSMDGLLRRSTPAVLGFAADEATPLVRHDVPARERVPFRKRDAFAAAVAAGAEQTQEGDVLVIHGLREEDLEEHYHTALVLETDPATGIPTLLADNAGRPRIRSLAAVMASAPRRTIKYRLRIDLAWLLEQRRRGPAGIDGGTGFSPPRSSGPVDRSSSKLAEPYLSPHEPTHKMTP